MQLDLKNCTITLRDGTLVTPNTLEITLGEGNIKWSEKVNRIYTKNKGALDEVRNGDEDPIEVSFEFTWKYVTGSSTTGAVPTPIDALKNIGNASTWLSSDSDGCRPYAVDIIIVHTPVPSTCGDKETYTLSDFRYEGMDFDLSAATISCSGKCNVTEAVVLREAQP